MEATLEKKQVKFKGLDYSTDPNLYRDVKELLTAINTSGAPAIETLDTNAARKVLEDAQASVSVDLSGIEESKKTIEADGYTIDFFIVRPEGVTKKLPVFIFVHGGGWILGDYPTHKRMIRDLVVMSGCAAVHVEYTRTPDTQFPRAINEIYAATKWVAENGDEINVDGNNMAIVGNSVGGNMTAVTALKAIENNGPKIKALVMMWPLTDASMEHESYKLFGKDRFLTAKEMAWMFDLYSTDREELNSKYISVLNAELEELQDFPPTLIITAGNDILRDEGEAFGRKLDEAGVKVVTTRYNGTIHDFGLLNALANDPTTKAMFGQAAGLLKKFLGN